MDRSKREGTGRSGDPGRGGNTERRGNPARTPQRSAAERRADGGTGDDRVEARRRELRRIRQQRRRRRQQIRLMLMLGFFILCILAGVFAAVHLYKGRAETARLEAELQAEAERQEAEARLAAEAMAEARTEPAGNAPWEGALPEIGAIYGISVNDVGWSHFFADDSYCMAPVDQFITAFRATVHNQPEGMTGTIEYSVNLSGSGWLDWAEDAEEAGDAAGAMPLESIRIQLTGQLGEYYDVLYSVLQDQAWTDWAQNGEEAGAYGVGKRLDGIRVSIVKKAEGQTSYAGGIDPTKPMIALTYDDGPSPKATPRILAKLEEYGGRATFFMVGKMAEKNTDLVRRMVEQGCEVANHTYDHTLMTKVAPEELAAQLARTNQVVSDASGISPVLMRPCGGAQSDVGMTVVGAISMPAVLWSVDTLDWKTRDAQSTVNTVLEKVKDGDIILMHDLYEATAEASEILIPELVNRGFQLVTVSELASYRGGMLPGRTYSKFRPRS